MIRINRHDLPTEIQAHLDLLQQAVDQQSPDAKTWDEFSATSIYQDLKRVLQQMFHYKCAYCDSTGAPHVEHHWPKSPHPHNARLGSKSKMFLWDNMLLACSTCNGFECKGAHMKWEADNSPQLLNPSVAEDDPLCFFNISLVENPSFALGWIDPRPEPTTIAFKRAEYTIRRLKLNVREDIRRGRARTINNFVAFTSCLLEFGPDHKGPSGNPIRHAFLQMLDAREPYLSPIRQMLYYEPAYAGLKEKLLEQMPEIDPIMSSWALLPPDCSQLAQALVLAPDATNDVAL